MFSKRIYMSLSAACLCLFLCTCSGQENPGAATSPPTSISSCDADCPGEPTLNSFKVWTAYNASCGCVNSAIQGAASGDTINIPAGEATWSSQLNLGAKKLSIIGNGIGSTVISAASDSLSIFNLGTGGSRLSNMTINNKSGVLYVSGQGFIIDHIRYYSGNAQLPCGEIQITGAVHNEHPTGVIHSNEFINTRITVIGATQWNFTISPSSHELWSQNIGLGSANNVVYVEGNSFTITRDAEGNIMDSNYGGRYVFRYNELICTNTGVIAGHNLQVHSMQANNRAAQLWEMYNNILNNQSSFSYFPFRIRGGTGVVFNNDILGNWTNYGIGLDNVRSYDEVSDAGRCDGTAPTGWDGNSDATGYPCRDQIGRGYDSVQWNHSPVAPYNQPLMPAYAWNNKKSDGTTEVPFMVIANSAQHIHLNRDAYNYTSTFNGTIGMGSGPFSARPNTCIVNTAYFATDQGPLGTLYKCTSTDNWSVYFTPCTCPHPLAGSGSCNPGVAGKAGYKQ